MSGWPLYLKCTDSWTYNKFVQAVINHRQALIRKDLKEAEIERNNAIEAVEFFLKNMEKYVEVELSMTFEK